MVELDIRRNDYIAAIRHDITELRMSLDNYEALETQCTDLINLCAGWKLRKFRRVAKYEYKLLVKKHKWELKRLEELTKLLYLAEKYAPSAARR